MKTVTLAELSVYLQKHGFPNSIEGSREVTITAANTLSEAGSGEISFLANTKYREHLLSSRAAAVIVARDETVPEGMNVLRCENPYGAIAAAIQLIHGARKHPQWGVDPRSDISDSARIGVNANIGPFVTIAEDVTIGANATIYPGCFIGSGVTIGDDATFYPNVVIYDGSCLGDRVTLHSGTVIGQDGLGYAPVDGEWMKIPQAGRVRIEDDVEMGAGCAIDRATLGETRVGRGTKFSDQVVLGHGTKVGKHNMYVAQVGLAGSVHVGDHVTMGGQVGVAGHLSIGDNVTIGAKSGVWSDIPANDRYFGNPAFKWRRYWRQLAAIKELPQLIRTLRRMEKQIDDLVNQLEARERSR